MATQETAQNYHDKPDGEHGRSRSNRNAQDRHPRERKAKQGGNSATDNDDSIGARIWGIGSGCWFTRGPNDLEFAPKGPDPNDEEDGPIRPREKQGRRHRGFSRFDRKRCPTSVSPSPHSAPNTPKSAKRLTSDALPVYPAIINEKQSANP